MFNVHLYDYSSFDFGLETELDLHVYSSVTKFSKFEILNMCLAKTQLGQSIFSSDQY